MNLSALSQPIVQQELKHQKQIHGSNMQSETRHRTNSSNSSQIQSVHSPPQSPQKGQVQQNISLQAHLLTERNSQLAKPQFKDIKCCVIGKRFSGKSSLLARLQQQAQENQFILYEDSNQQRTNLQYENTMSQTEYRMEVERPRLIQQQQLNTLGVQSQKKYDDQIHQMQQSEKINNDEKMEMLPKLENEKNVNVQPSYQEEIYQSQRNESNKSEFVSINLPEESRLNSNILQQSQNAVSKTVDVCTNDNNITMDKIIEAKNVQKNVPTEMRQIEQIQTTNEKMSSNQEINEPQEKGNLQMNETSSPSTPSDSPTSIQKQSPQSNQTQSNISQQTQRIHQKDQQQASTIQTNVSDQPQTQQQNEQTQPQTQPQTQSLQQPQNQPQNQPQTQPQTQPLQQPQNQPLQQPQTQQQTQIQQLSSQQQMPQLQQSSQSQQTIQSQQSSQSQQSPQSQQSSQSQQSQSQRVQSQPLPVMRNCRSYGNDVALAFYHFRLAHQPIQIWVNFHFFFLVF